MQYTHLGRTGLVVSRLCLGTMNFGPDTSEDDSFTPRALNSKRTGVVSRARSPTRRTASNSC